MKKTALRLAQIGVGGYGQTHLRTIQPFIESGDVQLIAAADPATNRLLQKKAEFESQGIRWYEDYREMLDKHGDSLDIINIATPIPLHEDMATFALKTKAHIYLEKPPVPTLGQLDKLIELDKNKRVNVAFQGVSHPNLRQARRWIESGAFGKPRNVMVVASWPRLDAYYGRSSWAGTMTWRDLYTFDGPATNANSHWINNIMFLLGKGHDYAMPHTVVGEFYRARPIESYDTCSIAGTLECGTEFTVNFTHASPDRIGNDLHLVGDKGWVSISEGSAGLQNSLGLQMDSDIISSEDGRNHNYKSFIAYIRGEKEVPPCTLANTRGYVATTIGALISSGGIHDIPRELVSRYQAENDEGYQVKGIFDLILKAKTEPRVFSQLAPEWGKPGKPVQIKDIVSYDIRSLFQSRS